MALGFESILKEAERQKENSGGDYGPPHLTLKLPGHLDAAQVRFLEQGDEVFSYHSHDLTKELGNNPGWKYNFPCLDEKADGTPCPGCEQELKRSFKGLINVIWRDAPIYETDDKGYNKKDSAGKWTQVGKEDQVAVFKQGITVFTALAQKDVAAKGLSSRDWIITRSGTSVDNTAYQIEPADMDSGPSPMSEADEKLAADKYDLTAIANFKTYDEAKAIIQKGLGQADGNDSQSSGDVKSFVSDTPFS